MTCMSASQENGFCIDIEGPGNVSLTDNVSRHWNKESRGANRRFPQRPWDSTAFYVGQVFVFQ
jgi:hypothetical protein